MYRCAKAAIADIDASGSVDLVDFVTFTRCNGITWSWDSVNDEFTFSLPLTQDEEAEVLRCDFNQGGGVDLADFMILSGQFGSGDGVQEDCNVGMGMMGGPESEPDMGLLLAYVDGPLRSHRLHDPGWLEAVDRIARLLSDYDPTLADQLAETFRHLPW